MTLLSDLVFDRYVPVLDQHCIPITILNKRSKDKIKNKVNNVYTIFFKKMT